MHSGAKQKINIQYCNNCHLHSWCTHHDQQKYKEAFHELMSALQTQFGNIQVFGNVPPNYYVSIKPKQNKFFDAENKKYCIFPAIGAFEVTHNGEVIFSKKKTEQWPVASEIVDEIRQRITGKSKNSKNGSIKSEKQQAKQIDSQNNYQKDRVKQQTQQQFRKTKKNTFSRKKINQYKQQQLYKLYAEYQNTKSRASQQQDQNIKQVWGKNLPNFIKNGTLVQQNKGKREIIVNLSSIEEENDTKNVFPVSIGKKNKMKSLDKDFDNLEKKFLKFERRVSKVNKKNFDQSTISESTLQQKSFKSNKNNSKMKLKDKINQVNLSYCTQKINNERAKKIQEYIYASNEQKNEQLGIIYGPQLLQISNSRVFRKNKQNGQSNFNEQSGSGSGESYIDQSFFDVTNKQKRKDGNSFHSFNQKQSKSNANLKYSIKKRLIKTREKLQSSSKQNDFQNLNPLNKGNYELSNDVIFEKQNKMRQNLIPKKNNFESSVKFKKTTKKMVRRTVDKDDKISDVEKIYKARDPHFLKIQKQKSLSKQKSANKYSTSRSKSKMNDQNNQIQMSQNKSSRLLFNQQSLINLNAKQKTLRNASMKESSSKRKSEERIQNNELSHRYSKNKSFNRSNENITQRKSLNKSLKNNITSRAKTNKSQHVSSQLHKSTSQFQNSTLLKGNTQKSRKSQTLNKLSQRLSLKSGRYTSRQQREKSEHISQKKQKKLTGKSQRDNSLKNQSQVSMKKSYKSNRSEKLQKSFDQNTSKRLKNSKTNISCKSSKHETMQICVHDENNNVLTESKVKKVYQQDQIKPETIDASTQCLFNYQDKEQSSSSNVEENCSEDEEKSLNTSKEQEHEKVTKSNSIKEKNNIQKIQKEQLSPQKIIKQSSHQKKINQFQYKQAAILKQIYGDFYQNFINLKNEQSKFKKSIKSTITDNLFDIDCLEHKSIVDTSKKLGNLIKIIKILSDKNQYLFIRLFETKINNDGTAKFGIWLCKDYSWNCYHFNQQFISKQINNPTKLWSSAKQFWSIVLAEALTQMYKGVQNLSQATLSQLFHNITGSNYVNFKVKEDPQKNIKLLKFITLNEKKNFIILAQRRLHKSILQDIKSTTDNPIYYVLSQKSINNNQILIKMRKNNEQCFWVKLDIFVAQFSLVQVLQLRVSHNFCKLPIQNINSKNLQVLQLTFKQQSFGSVAFSIEKGETDFKLYAYREEQENVLKLIGQSKQKNKKFTFFDCCFEEGKYTIFSDFKGTNKSAFYMGENNPKLKIKQNISQVGLKNDFIEYLPIEQAPIPHKKQMPKFLSISKTFQNRQMFESSSAWSSRLDKNKLKRQFVDYLTTF